MPAHEVEYIGENRWISGVVQRKSPAVTRQEASVCVVDEQGKEWTAEHVYDLDDSPNDILKDLTFFAKKFQGLRNLPNVDCQRVIEPYAEDFATQYEPYLNSFLSGVYDYVKERLLQAFQDAGSTKAQEAIESVKKEALKLLEKHRKSAKECVNRIIGYNKPPLVFSTNDHYFCALLQQFSKSEEQKKLDEFGPLTLVDRIKAYLKVQRKVIEETGAKEVIGYFYRDFPNEFKKFIKSPKTLEEYSKIVEASSTGKELKRLENLMKERDDLQNCLKKIKL